MKPGVITELETTKGGFRCRYAFEKAVLWIQVQERKLVFDEKTESFATFWFLHSNVASFFGCSREQAKRLAEHHVGFYDADLAATLAPVWEAWSAVPEREANSEQTENRGPMN